MNLFKGIVRWFQSWLAPEEYRVVAIRSLIHESAKWQPVEVRWQGNTPWSDSKLPEVWPEGDGHLLEGQFDVQMYFEKQKREGDWVRCEDPRIIDWRLIESLIWNNLKILPW